MKIILELAIFHVEIIYKIKLKVYIIYTECIGKLSLIVTAYY